MHWSPREAQILDATTSHVNAAGTEEPIGLVRRNTGSTEPAAQRPIDAIRQAAAARG